MREGRVGAPVSTPVIFDNFELQFIGTSKIELLGSLNSEDAQAELSSQFLSLHQGILKGGLSAFVIDVRGLKLANSSAIRLFVDWISRASDAGYKLEFHIDRSITWHRLSFDVLKSLAPDAVTVVNAHESTAATRTAS
jgi:hypothetical protein